MEDLPLPLSGFIPFGKAAAGRQWRRLDMHEEVASALDEHRNSDGLESAIRFEGLEFVELEGSGKSTAQSLVADQECFMQQLAVAAEALEAPFERRPPDTEDLRAAAETDLGAEQARDRRVEPWFAQTVVDAIRL
ncbi:MAG TPA: hypothetical protein VGC54_00975 [Planctomycetota bacterium]